MKQKSFDSSDEKTHEWKDSQNEKTPEWKDGQTSIVGGTFNIANAALGAGLLTFPKSFATTGLPLGVVLQLVLALLVFVCLSILGRVTHLTASHSYPMVLRRLLGRRVEIFVSCLLILYTWTSTIAYLQVMVKQLAVFGQVIDESSPWYLSGWFLGCIFAFFIVFLPFINLHNMARVSYISILAICACWYLVIFVVITSITKSNGCPNSVCAEATLNQTPYLWRLLGTFPAMCFGYQCHLSSVNNYSSLTTQAKASYSYVAFGGAMVCFATYTAVGVAGFLLFGPCAGVESLVLDNYSSKDIGANIGRAVIALAVALSYPVLGFVGRHEALRLFDSMIVKKQWEISERNIFIGTVNRRLFWISLLWFVSNMIIACIPGDGISIVINFIGTTAGFWMFIFPGLVAIKLADLTHEETIDAALATLPDAPCEEVSESWTNGIRNRVTRWLSPRERLMLRAIGIFMFFLGVLLTTLGYISFSYGIYRSFVSDIVPDVCTN